MIYISTIRKECATSTNYTSFKAITSKETTCSLFKETALTLDDFLLPIFVEEEIESY